jgi:cysteine desulfurase/selenocysteine lyase
MKSLQEIRADFPILSRNVHNKPLVYLDNGATGQKPSCVINCVSDYYSSYNSNIHRGVHHLSQVATTAYEEGRVVLQNFINAKHSHEVIFTKGTTDGINLVASCFGQKYISKEDEIIISTMEHHSNIVPWQMLCELTGATLRVVPINQRGELEMEAFNSMLSDKTKLIAITHISNTLGTINPISEIISKGHEVGAKVLIDAAQSVPHTALDVQELNCDFLVFSGHKMFGPTGTGILYGKESVLNDLPPYQGGGDMIKEVTFEKTTYNTLPHKFEAGTPNIAGGIGLAKSAEYILSIGYDFIGKHEAKLLAYGTSELKKIPGLRIVGEATNKASVISFLVDDIHPFDLGTILDQLGIAIRTGHHCTQPLMDFFKIPGTARASFAFYNTEEEIDTLVKGLERAIKMLK